MASVGDDPRTGSLKAERPSRRASRGAEFSCQDRAGCPSHGACDPRGFEGNIVLEMINFGPFHLKLVPRRTSICQLVFERLESEPADWYYNRLPRAIDFRAASAGQLKAVQSSEVKPFLQPADFVDALGTEFPPWSLADSLDHTRRLARSHYENFQLVSRLLPGRLHQDFFNVYAFCRWADDLGDEMGDAERGLVLLEWWREELAGLYAGRARHPVYVALRETVEKHDIPEEPFADLIRAFVQDQTVTRYADDDELLAYCRYSAQPCRPARAAPLWLHRRGSPPPV